LRWLWGRIGVAWGWLWGAYQLAINRLWGGFDVALMSHWGGLPSPPTAFLLSAFCFLLSLPGGFARPFDVGCWMLDVGCWMFALILCFFSSSAFAPVWLLPDDRMCPNSKHLRFVG
jgi:hypothetical protein